MVLGFYHGTTTVGDGSPKACNWQAPFEQSEKEQVHAANGTSKQTTEMSNNENEGANMSQYKSWSEPSQEKRASEFSTQKM
jgi:hypothetical protein